MAQRHRCPPAGQLVAGQAHTCKCTAFCTHNMHFHPWTGLAHPMSAESVQDTTRLLHLPACHMHLFLIQHPTQQLDGLPRLTGPPEPTCHFYAFVNHTAALTLLPMQVVQLQRSLFRYIFNNLLPPCSAVPCSHSPYVILTLAALPGTQSTHYKANLTALRPCLTCNRSENRQQRNQKLMGPGSVHTQQQQGPGVGTSGHR